MKLAILAGIIITFAWGEVVLTITKTPAEIIPCSMDFTQVVGMDTMVLTSVTASNVRTSADATPAIIAASPVPAIVGSTDVVSFNVQGGQVNGQYRISVKVSDTTSGALYEGVMILNVGAN
jgi:hypothetical protein